MPRFKKTVHYLNLLRVTMARQVSYRYKSKLKVIQFSYSKYHDIYEAVADAESVDLTEFLAMEKQLELSCRGQGIMKNHRQNEFKRMGFTEVKTADDTNLAIKAKGTTLVVINSVCGSAGSVMRPAIKHALETTQIKPDNLVTAFAGNDLEAVESIRDHLMDYQPSSPFVAIFRDGILMHALPRPIFKTLKIEQVEQIMVSVVKRYGAAELNESVEIFKPSQDDYVPNTCG